MPSCSVQVFRDEKAVLTLVGALFLLYFLSMDAVLFYSWQSTTLVDQPPAVTGHYSPFHPLSIKLLMTDHFSHYIINPVTEFFDEFTQFSTVFFFITPNMISIGHVLVALLAARCVSSESLYKRRVGCILYEIRTTLDGYDGVVFRSHAGIRGSYNSNHSSWGYVIDSFCDAIGGILLNFGVLFFLFKALPKAYDSIPTWTKNGGKESPGNGHANGYHPPGGQQTYSKKYIFFKVFVYGMAIGAAGLSWDHGVEKLKNVFQTKLTDPRLEAVQTSYLHSLGLGMLMWAWRLCEGQALVQFLLVAIFLDKVWEFITSCGYLAWAVVITITIITFTYASHVHSILFPM